MYFLILFDYSCYSKHKTHVNVYTVKMSIYCSTAVSEVGQSLKSSILTILLTCPIVAYCCVGNSTVVLL